VHATIGFIMSNKIHSRMKESMIIHEHPCTLYEKSFLKSMCDLGLCPNMNFFSMPLPHILPTCRMMLHILCKIISKSIYKWKGKVWNQQIDWQTTQTLYGTFPACKMIYRLFTLWHFTLNHFLQTLHHFFSVSHTSRWNMWDVINAD
jgi:hypothetical protein